MDFFINLLHNPMFVEALTLITQMLEALLSILLVYIAWRINKSLWFSQKLVEERINVYKETAPKLNDLYCYYCYVGNWKDNTPETILQHKRELDKCIHMYQYIFSDEFMKKYYSFMNTYFKTFNEMGTDARLRTEIKHREKFWEEQDKDRFKTMFAPSQECPPTESAIEVYGDFMRYFAQELGLNKVKVKQQQ